MKILPVIWVGKLLAIISRTLKFGAGSTWPGHLALQIEPHIFTKLASQLQKGIILVAGTNGKTTTVKMISQIVDKPRIKNPGLSAGRQEQRAINNDSGANLFNGIVSALIKGTNWFGRLKIDWGIFEVDEATLPVIINSLKSTDYEKRLIIVLLNLFRDQLDRYGEIDTIARQWKNALLELPKLATVILNADDPHVAFLAENLKASIYYFGLNDTNFFQDGAGQTVDSLYCPKCGQKLLFDGFFLSHLGHWKCLNCGLRRPSPNLSFWFYPLPGIYNRYNTLAAISVAKVLGLKEKEVKKSLAGFKPAFGRQEDFEIDDKNIKIILSKNPAGFDESIRVLKGFPNTKKTILLVLNDRIPDGRDVSWIWDVDFEMIADYADFIILSGDRVYDLALRMKYACFDQDKTLINADLKKAIKEGLKKINEGETLYILPTYSAMLEVRKIITGHKLLWVNYNNIYH